MSPVTAGLVTCTDRFTAVTVGREVVVYHSQPTDEEKDSKKREKTPSELKKPRRFKGHAALIITLQSDPSDLYSVISASEDGVIIKWQPLTMEAVVRYHLRAPFRGVSIVAQPTTAALHAVALTAERLLLCPLDATSDAEPSTVFAARDQSKWACPVCTCLNRANLLACGRRGCPGTPPPTLPALAHFAATAAYAAVAYERLVLVGQLFASGAVAADGSLPRWLFRSQHSITALALDPASCTIAVGDKLGRIELYRWPADLPSGSEIKGPSTHHWHSTAIRRLAWSCDGTQLLSTAQEGVLCCWLPQFNMQRSVLPRLGNVVAFAIDEKSMTIAVTTEPNQLHWIDAVARRVKATRTDLSFSQSAPFYTRLAPCPDGKTVATFGRLNSVGFHHPTLGVAVGVQTVQPLNYICALEGEEPVIAEVEHVVFSSNGEWMVTMSQTDTMLAPGLFVGVLRFWARQEAAGAERYACATLAYQPHGGRVTALAYHPTLDLLLSTGGDGRAKLWGVHESERGRHWRVLHTAELPPPAPVAGTFSADSAGSLVLLAHGPLVCILRSDDLTVPCEDAELAQSLTEEPLRGVVMLADVRTVVAHSESFVFLWDIRYRALLRAIKLRADFLVPLPGDPEAPALTTPAYATLAAGRIVELRADRSLPHFVSSTDVAPAAIRSLAVVEDRRGQRCYALLDATGSLCVFTPSDDSPSVLAQLNKSIPEPAAGATEDEAPLPPLPAPTSIPPPPPSLPPAPRPLVLQRTVERCNFLFGPETHSLPPVRALYDRFMANFLAPAPPPMTESRS